MNQRNNMKTMGSEDEDSSSLEYAVDIHMKLFTAS